MATNILCSLDCLQTHVPINYTSEPLHLAGVNKYYCNYGVSIYHQMHYIDQGNRDRKTNTYTHTHTHTHTHTNTHIHTEGGREGERENKNT